MVVTTSNRTRTRSQSGSSSEANGASKAPKPRRTRSTGGEERHVKHDRSLPRRLWRIRGLTPIWGRRDFARGIAADLSVPTQGILDFSSSEPVQIHEYRDATTSGRRQNSPPSITPPTPTTITAARSSNNVAPSSGLPSTEIFSLAEAMSTTFLYPTQNMPQLDMAGDYNRPRSLSGLEFNGTMPRPSSSSGSSNYSYYTASEYFPSNSSSPLVPFAQTFHGSPSGSPTFLDHAHHFHHSPELPFIETATGQGLVADMLPQSSPTAFWQPQAVYDWAYAADADALFVSRQATADAHVQAYGYYDPSVNHYSDITGSTAANAAFIDPLVQSFDGLSFGQQQQDYVQEQQSQWNDNTVYMSTQLQTQTPPYNVYIDGYAYQYA